MQKSAIIVLIGLIAVASMPARSDEAETLEAINNAAIALDQAITRQDKDAARDLMTPDHLAVTPYYGGPQNISDQLESLSALKYRQTIVGEKALVVLLGPETVTRRFAAQLKGTFKGRKLPTLVYISEIWVKAGGRWREEFSQATTLRP